MTIKADSIAFMLDELLFKCVQNEFENRLASVVHERAHCAHVAPTLLVLSKTAHIGQCSQRTTRANVGVDDQLVEVFERVERVLESVRVRLQRATRLGRCSNTAKFE